MLTQNRACVAGLACLLAIGSVAICEAAPPWQSLMPFKRLDADPDKSYELEENHGPWLVMCTTFAGPTAEQQAHDLVLELRRQHRLEAFTFKQTFDFTQSEDGLGVDKYGNPKRMKPMNRVKFDEVAVMVGNYQSVDDPNLERVLKQLKHAKPETLAAQPAKRYNALREFYRTVSKDPEQKQKGPMGSAFITRNPMIPEEFFVAKGLDPFVVELNREVANSLLTNKGKYTVRVASFRGVDTLKPDEFEKQTSITRPKAKIDEAGEKADKLTAALRRKGVDAYQFHDRTESIVCIGSFNSVGEPRADGKQEINPAVYRIMQDFGPEKKQFAGQSGTVLAPRMIDGIMLDAQPLPVEVPRQSVAAAYNRSVQR